MWSLPSPGPLDQHLSPRVPGPPHFVSDLCQLQVVPDFRYSTFSLIDDFPDVVVPDKRILAESVLFRG